MHLFEDFEQQIIFRRELPSKLVNIEAKGALRNILRSVSQKWISQINTKGDPLGRHGIKSLRGGVRPRIP